jgi:hypothetical protein
MMASKEPLEMHMCSLERKWMIQMEGRTKCGEAIT